VSQWKKAFFLPPAVFDLSMYNIGGVLDSRAVSVRTACFLENMKYRPSLQRTSHPGLDPKTRGFLQAFLDQTLFFLQICSKFVDSSRLFKSSKKAV
jgi:hypothetical protein